MKKVSPDQLELPFMKEKKKMNMLNSVLVEGLLTEDPNLDLDTKYCFFNINCSRENKSNIFRIVTRDRLAEVCNDYLKEGRGIRVVGRLVRFVDNEVGIEAEHIEFKPKANNNE